MENHAQKKPRTLCLHGFGASGEILQSMLQTRWPETVLEKLDMVYLDGPFPVQGKSPLEGVYDPPYYEWFQTNEDRTCFTNFEECVKYLEDYMVKNGPFDGILGSSQGGVLAASLPGMQNEGVALTRVPKIKFLILISAGKFGGSTLGTPELAANAFSSPIGCPSLHFIGTDARGGFPLQLKSFPLVIWTSKPSIFLSAEREPCLNHFHHLKTGDKDPLKPGGEDLVEAFVDPFVIRHPAGHTIPTLDEKEVEVVLGFIKKIGNVVAC